MFVMALLQWLVIFDILLLVWCAVVDIVIVVVSVDDHGDGGGVAGCVSVYSVVYVSCDGVDVASVAGVNVGVVVRDDVGYGVVCMCVCGVDVVGG